MCLSRHSSQPKEKATLPDSQMTPLFLQAPSGQGSQSSTGELKCGHGVPGPSLMEQFTVLAEITPELLCCPVHSSQHIPAPSLRHFPRLQGPHNRHSTQTGWELSPQPTPGALHTHLPSSRSLRGPYLSMTIPKGSVMALSRKEPMVKAKFSISSWALQEGHLCSEAVLFSPSELLVVVSAQGERGQLG